MTYDRKPSRFKGKMPPKIWDKGRFEVWDKPDFQKLEIQNMAPGLSRAETLLYYNLEEDDLPDYDLWFFDVHYNRGRLLAKQNATAKLMDCMDGNAQAILAYMSRFGKEEWQNTPTGGSGKQGAGEITVKWDGIESA